MFLEPIVKKLAGKLLSTIEQLRENLLLPRSQYMYIGEVCLYCFLCRSEHHSPNREFLFFVRKRLVADLTNPLLAGKCLEIQLVAVLHTHHRCRKLGRGIHHPQKALDDVGKQRQT